MLSVASRCSGQVDACDSKREYLCSMVGSCLQFSGRVTITSKIVDVLLPLGENSGTLSKDNCIAYITHFA